MGEVWELSLPANEQIVLLAMADHADHLGGNVYPSNGLIAWKVGMSESTVRRMKQRLERRGILVLEEAVPGCVKHYRIDTSKGEHKAPFVSRASQTPTAKPNPSQVETPRKLTPLPSHSSATPPPANCDPSQVGRGSKALTPLPSQSSATPPLSELCDPNRQITVNEPSNARALPEAAIPTWAEVKAEAQMRGVPEKSAKAFFDHHEGNALWLNQHNRLINWRVKLTSWAANDRQPQRNHYANRPDRNAGTFNANQDVAALESKVW